MSGVMLRLNDEEADRLGVRWGTVVDFFPVHPLELSNEFYIDGDAVRPFDQYRLRLTAVLRSRLIKKP